LLLTACNTTLQADEFCGREGEVKLLILNPGHFHADLILKKTNPRISPDVYIYAPSGTELDQHVSRIQSYNARDKEPTSWNPIMYKKDNFFKQMIHDKNGNVVVLAGNNELKTSYILKSVEAGFNVLSDKPLAINEGNFKLLKEALELAEKKQLVVYDMMTERFNLLNMIQKRLVNNTSLFGNLQTGSEDDPAIKQKSVHHFYKQISGSPLIRPAWYYDVAQQGEGVVDVTTHMIDLINWTCFDRMLIDYTKDVDVYNAKRWSTELTLDEFSASTKLHDFPVYLDKYIDKGKLKVFSNGEIGYKINQTHVRLKVQWDYQAPVGGGDTHSSVIKGTNATCEIVQDMEHDFIPQLYFYKNNHIGMDDFKANLVAFIEEIRLDYPSVSLVRQGDKYLVKIPLDIRESHETHFSNVADSYFDFLMKGQIPAWEKYNILAKYFITTTALKIAKTVPECD
jgi:predicted dehydrogenase